MRPDDRPVDPDSDILSFGKRQQAFSQIGPVDKDR
jgi:hypothetical protein